MEKSRRKIGKTAIIVIVVVCGVGLAGILGVSAVVSRLRSAGVSDVQSVVVADGTIESTVTGTGTLEYQDAVEVPVPPGLKIVNVLQGQGRQVEAGQILATVDRTGCETLMSDVYAQIAEVDQQLLDTPSEPEVVEVKAPVAGTVAAVNVARGSSVLDALSAAGSLVTLSTGSRMGAAIHTSNADAALPGETVVLEFADGNRRSATVEDTQADGFTAVLTDPAGATEGDVTASTPAGEVIGTGRVQPLDTVSIVAPAGTVQNVDVSAGTAVKAGTVLFTVKSSGKPAAYMELKQRRDSLSETYDELASIYTKGGITAPISGAIVTCAVEAGQNTSAISGGSGIMDAAGQAAGEIPFSSPQEALNMFGTGMSTRPTQQSGSMLLLGAPAPDGEPEETSSSDDGPEQDSSPAGNPAPEQVPLPTERPECQVRDIPRIEVPLVPPIAGLPLQHHVAVLPVYTGTVTWNPDDVQAQHSTDYTARVVLKAMDGFRFAEDCTAEVLNGTVSETAVDGTIMSFLATYPRTREPLDLSDIDLGAIQDILGTAELDIGGLKDLLSSGLLSSAELGGLDPSDLYSQIDPTALYGQVDPSVLSSMSQVQGLDALNGLDASTVLPDVASTYGALESTNPTAYTIAPDDTMQLVIQVNQMDILSVRPGMACSITVDALSDRTFEGTVSEVSETTNGGDYTAHIVMPRDPDMRAGMTASAVIVTQETSDVLTIPVAALQEDGNRVFVYAGYDEGADEFRDELEVETGVSNGSEVQILGGLEPGQTIYYRQSDPFRSMMQMMGGPREGQDDNAQATRVPPGEAIATP